MSVTRALPAVDMKDNPGHERRRFEVKYSANDVGDIAHVTDRVQHIELIIHCIPMHRRPDHAGRHGVHANPPFCILDGERPCRRSEPAFRQRGAHGRHAGIGVIGDGSISRDVATTRWPRSRQAATSAAPIPCDAPVTIATFRSVAMAAWPCVCSPLHRSGFRRPAPTDTVRYKVPLMVWHAGSAVHFAIVTNFMKSHARSP